MPGTEFFVSNACKWGAQSRFKMSATTVNLFSPENSSMIQWRLFYPGLIHISRIARLCAGWLMDGFPYIKRGIGGFSFDGARWDVSLFRTAQKEILSSEIISSGDHTPFITFVHKKSVSSLKACFPFTLSVYDEPIKCERRKGILKRVRWLLWGRREGEEE